MLRAEWRQSEPLGCGYVLPYGSAEMTCCNQISRRRMLKGAAATGILVCASGELFGQQPASRFAAGPTPPLPPRTDFVIRGATVLTMDPNLGDLETGDVHVRDGTIQSIGARIQLGNIEVIEG